MMKLEKKNPNFVLEKVPKCAADVPWEHHLVLHRFGVSGGLYSTQVDDLVVIERAQTPWRSWTSGGRERHPAPNPAARVPLHVGR